MKCSVLIYTLLLLFPLLVWGEDRYVALSTGNDVWVLRIDTSGKVLESHHQHVDYFATTVGISPVQTNSGPALAIFRTENAVDVTRVESALFEHGTFSEFHDFGGRVLSEAGVLQVTQRPSSNWLLARSVFSRLYQSFGINSSQEWNGKMTTVSPPLPGSIVAASISADGRMLTESIQTKSGLSELVDQQLSGNSSRNGDPAVIGLSMLATAVDCSNILNGRARIVVYRVSHVVGIDEVETQVFLQRIHASTGMELGSAISLTPKETRVVTLADSSQSVAIDPQGLFVLYTAAGECGKKVLKFQTLDSNGDGSTSAKVVFGCNRVADTHSGVESVDVSMMEITNGSATQQ